METPSLCIVVPCYNEEEVLSETIKQLGEVLEGLISEALITENSCAMFIDDGSRDKTWSLIEEYNKTNKYVKGLKLSKNMGHQNALMAGLMTCKEYFDCIISIDADLQDDVKAIREMVLKHHEGCDIVYGVRNERKTDTFFKRFTAETFYKFMKMMGVNIVYNHADYRLMSKRALDELAKFNEVNLFLRGIVPMLGFKSDSVYYNRNERFAGESKYPLKKMISFAFDGITSLSISPIRFITFLGFLILTMSVFAIMYVLASKIFGYVVYGWSSIMISVWVLGSLQLISIGLVGEYIGKIYRETKARPRFIVEKVLM